MGNRFRGGSNAASKGLSTLGWLFMIPVALIALLIIAIGFYELRKAYWDDKVKDMCEKDGGVVVNEKVSISAEQYRQLPKVSGSVSIPPEATKPEFPAFSTLSETVLRDGEPRVIRREQVIKRTSDGKEIGRIVSYSRVGGDIPIGIDRPTSFSCPEYKLIYSEQAWFFSVSGESR